MKINLILSLLALIIVSFSSCDKDNPISPTCNLTVTVQQEGNSQLIANITGGTPAYTYKWTDGSTANPFVLDSSQVGNYGVTVTDSEGCTAETTFEISGDTTCTQFSVSILNQNNKLKSSPQNGKVPYTFVWSSGETTADIDYPFLGGIYSVTVTDANGCNAIANHEITIDSCGAFSVAISKENNKLKSNTQNGQIPYAYVWSTGEITADIDYPFLGGTYSVTVTDANGCDANADYQINVDSCGAFSVAISNANNKLNALIENGEAPYAYVWSSGEITEAIDQPTTDGTYSVTATDANGCTDNTSYYFAICDSSTFISYINFSANPSGGGDLMVIVDGGVPPYSYEWSTGNAPEPNITITTPGTYTVTVTDSNGCTTISSYTLEAPCDGFLVDIIRNDSISTSIQFYTVITKGSAPFSYQWGGLGSGTTPSIELDLGTSGPISVTVTDSNGCTTEDNDQF